MWSNSHFWEGLSCLPLDVFHEDEHPSVRKAKWQGWARGRAHLGAAPNNGNGHDGGATKKKKKMILGDGGHFHDEPLLIPDQVTFKSWHESSFLNLSIILHSR